MPYPVQVQRYGRVPLKRLGLTSYLPLSFIEDIVPVFDMFADSMLSRFLRDESSWSRHTVRAAGGVGTFAEIILSNPLGSTELLVVERGTLLVGGGSVAWGITAAGAAGGHTTQAMDTRLLASGRSVGTISTAVPGAAFFTPNIPAEVIEAATRQRIDYQVVIAPGSALILEAQTANVALEAALRWYEVPLSPQELTSG
jgi:hypothetical protein